MIHPDSRTYEWIDQVATDNGVKDKSLAEKTIRAFSVLEALVRSGCPLIFKGGTSLMLHLNSAKRLSIDIDIICPPDTQIEDYLHSYSAEYGFGEIKRNSTANGKYVWYKAQDMTEHRKGGGHTRQQSHLSDSSLARRTAHKRRTMVAPTNIGSPRQRRHTNISRNHLRDDSS